jgi:iron complex outermembrane recepter protein
VRRIQQVDVAACAGFVFLSVAVQAQSVNGAPSEAGAANSSGLEEIVVTSSKYGEERVQKTPLAISVVGGDLLEKQGIDGARGLVNYVPNATFSQNTGSAIIYIRGIGSNNVSAGSDPDVTTQVDGVYIARPIGELADFLDVQRIEILRGPQGTLYGRNAVGGTLNVISRAPSDDFTGQVRLTYGNFNQYQADSYLSGPIVRDSLLGSLAVTYRGHDGFFDNIVPDKAAVGDANRGGAKGQLRWAVNPNIDATTRVDYFQVINERLESYSNLLAPVSFPAPLANSLVGSFDKVALDANQTLNQWIGGVSQDVNWRVGNNLTFKSITGWRSTTSSVVNDSDATEIFGTLLHIKEADQQFSQEFDLSYAAEQLKTVMGAYYFSDLDDQRNVVDSPPSVATPASRAVEIAASPDINTHSEAIFAQGTYEIVPSLSVTAGTRYTTEKKTMDQVFRRTSLNPATPGLALPGSPSIFSLDRRDGAVTPKFGLDYQASPQVLIYASATRGFKSGGFNFSAGSPVGAAFEPEKIWSYETGLKLDLLDRRLRFNVSAFYYDYSDLQVQLQLSPGNLSISNAAAAKVKGVELEPTFLVAPDLRISGNLSYLDATYSAYSHAPVPTGFGAYTPNQSCVASVCTTNATGHYLTGAPKESGVVAVDYTPEIGEHQLSVHVDYSWRSRMYFDPSNIAISSQKAYGLLNAYLGFGRASLKGFRYEVFGKNLANQGYYQTIAGNGPSPLGLVGDPRTYGVRAAYSW